MANARIVDGSYDFSDGVDSNKVSTVASDLNPNGLKRSQLAWLVNASVRGGGIIQRTGCQPIMADISSAGWWQGGYMYEPDNANPYLVCSIGGHIIQVTLEAPYTVTDLSAAFGLYNPPDADQAFFRQAEQFLVIQAGDFFTNPTPTLPLFWDGNTLRRSLGIISVNNIPGGVMPYNELPAATCMDYYMGRLWYAQGRTYGAGDIVKSADSGSAPYQYRDSVLKVTENPLAIGGDNFVVPDNAGNIRALDHTEAIDTALGQGLLYIFTRKSIYSLSVPVTRTDWIAADSDNQPLQRVVQVRYGTTSDKCTVRVNGDLFYQTMEPGIRSLTLAVRYYQQWANTDISANEQRLLQFVDRSLLHHASGIEFNNRLLQTSMPYETPVGVAHQAVIPMDFDPLGSFGADKTPVWEGHYEGLNFLQLFEGDFGGRQRAFTTVVSKETGTIDLWEITNYDRRENGDNRVTWIVESPAYTFGKEYAMKDLESMELWIDKLYGTVDFQIQFRPDSDPCWHDWAYFQRCTARTCSESEDNPLCYPVQTYRESYDAMIALPKPPTFCASNGVRPVNRGYQFQVRIVIKGWCRIRGILLYGLSVDKEPFNGMACQNLLKMNGAPRRPTPTPTPEEQIGIIGEVLTETEFITGEGGEILIGE